ncbi:hypothetical protein [Flammeovirga aprica]|uniref:Uncharacterized protein n=1 Tax=Flammeovirga aprica JL-4 TaxID=694437 RepID=A0A7X9S0I6_9BACT|nr:hypothetical protein [Flammeovirga aprica]NME72168.1 hypothetical protein [Flammeovirga aprica JL-4]
MTQSTRNTTPELQNGTLDLTTQPSQDELTIHIKSSIKHNSSTERSNLQPLESSKLLSMFQETLHEKGEEHSLENHLIGSNEVEFQKGKLSYSTLHSFLLKAESMGKKLSYEKIYTVKITD